MPSPETQLIDLDDEQLVAACEDLSAHRMEPTTQELCLLSGLVVAANEQSAAPLGNMDEAAFVARCTTVRDACLADPVDLSDGCASPPEFNANCAATVGDLIDCAVSSAATDRAFLAVGNCESPLADVMQGYSVYSERLRMPPDSCTKFVGCY